MSESGQPGAATPGEHGDGTGQHDDLARSASGWAPPAAGWSRRGEAGREPAPVWRQPDPTAGWGASSTRHGDLPAPLAGLPAGEPPARVNGRPHVNGVRHAEEEPPVTRQAPVSAPPADEPRRDLDADRLVVPAQRPAPAVEQPSADAEPGRHASDDPPASRGSRWAEGTVPSSAPPAMQVPPVGTAAAGFEVPPGFHAPIVERGAPEPAPSLSHGWADRVPPEPPPAEPADHRNASAEEPGWRAEPADERRAAPAEESEWQGPSWNRPSWGNGWAPSWPREDEPGGRRVRDERAAEWVPEPTRPYEPVRAEPARPYEPVRAEPTPAYETPPARPYEVARTDGEPRPTYEWENVDRPSWAGGAPAATPFSPPPQTAPTSAPPVPHATPTSAPPVSREAPASAPPDAGPAGVAPVPREAPGGAPAYGVPAGAPPAAYPPSAGPEPAPPAAVRSAEDRTVRPFRLRPQAEEVFATPPAGTGGHPPPPAGPGPATAPSGVARFDRVPAPAPTSAPPYAARRSAPEPVPTAEPVADTRPDDGASAMLPQRVPAEPDVPVVPEPPAVEPSAETPELARIATHLRRDDEPAPLRERPEGFDVNAILDAVREVAGVRDAALRRTPAGAHSLRLDLADGADPAEVSRQVARLLQERMGLAAAPQNLPGMPATPPPPVRRRSAEGRADRGAAETRPAEERAGASRTGPARADARAPESRDPGAPESRTAEEPEGRAGRLAEASAAGGPEGRTEPRAEPESPRRRRQAAPHRGRATVEETSLAAAPAGTPTGSPATLGTSYSGGQMSTTETAPSRPLDTGGAPGPRVVIDHVQVSTFGLDATVEVRLLAGDGTAEGRSTGPAVDGYVLRLCAVAAAVAVDELLRGAAQSADRGRCFVEHAAVVPFGNCEVATVVVLLVCDGWVEQLAGSALVAGDPRQAVVRATLAAVNRRLEALLA
ncbi:hypothetical protein [Micromonospora inositola]|uniref:Uncharacterized protein n=1 Tax=Micromonospora inositola TaxID=47865 RepID=A0A1C5I9G1_9ACTN|nr:hypothetical protein [Micromonospora inositola]SCG55028.1 hypothetical protein GA0070613_2493 [Micromonospora inositola]